MEDLMEKKNSFINNYLKLNYMKIIDQNNIINSIKNIKSNNLYYIERKIKKLITENNIILNTNLVNQIYDYLDYKSDWLNQTLKCISLNQLLTKDLD